MSLKEFFTWAESTPYLQFTIKCAWKASYDSLYCKKELIKPEIPLISNLPQERICINDRPF